MFRLLGKPLLIKLLFVAWLCVTESPLLLLLWLVRDHGQLASALRWITAPLGFVFFIGSWWLGLTTAHYMVDENQMFLDSVRRTLSDLRLRLAFIPIVGWWFTPDENMSDLRDDDAEGGP